MQLNVGALEIMDEVSKADRREIARVMFNEGLEKTKYPRIEYRSSRVSMAKTGENVYRIDGDLTLHGITRGRSLDAQIVASQDTLRHRGPSH